MEPILVSWQLQVQEGMNTCQVNSRMYITSFRSLSRFKILMSLFHAQYILNLYKPNVRIQKRYQESNYTKPYSDWFQEQNKYVWEHAGIHMKNIHNRMDWRQEYRTSWNLPLTYIPSINTEVSSLHHCILTTHMKLKLWFKSCREEVPD